MVWSSRKITPLFPGDTRGRMDASPRQLKSAPKQPHTRGTRSARAHSSLRVLARPEDRIGRREAEIRPGRDTATASVPATTAAKWRRCPTVSARRGSCGGGAAEGTGVTLCFCLCVDCPGTGSAQAGRGTACQGCPNQRLCASGVGAAPDPGKAGARPEREVKGVDPEEAGRGRNRAVTAGGT